MKVSEYCCTINEKVLPLQAKYKHIKIMEEIIKNIKGHYFKGILEDGSIRLIRIDKIKRDFVYVDFYGIMVEYAPEYEMMLRVDINKHLDDSYDNLKKRGNILNLDYYTEISKDDFYKEIDDLFDKTKTEYIK